MRSERVARDDTLHLGRIGIGHRLASARNPRVVDEDSDRAEVGFDLTDHFAVLFKIVDRRLVRSRAPTERLDRRNHFGRRIGIAPVVDRHIGAIFRQRYCNAAAHSATRAGDQRDSSC